MASKYQRLPALWGDLGLTPACTLQEVANALGTSPERARQLEARALGKLRQALAERGYALVDLLDTSKRQEERP